MVYNTTSGTYANGPLSVTSVGKVVLGAPLSGTYQGVKSPGTAYVLLHHYMGEIDSAYRDAFVRFKAGITHCAISVMRISVT